MLRKSFIVAALALVPALASVANAQFKQGDFDLNLGGSGENNHQFTSAEFSVAGSFGYFLTKDLEVSLRQNVAYTHLRPASEVWTGTTDVAIDYHFDFGAFVPFVGGNIGYSYGSHGVPSTWEFAPEAGIKYFLNSTTYLFGLAQYQIPFKHDNINGGVWEYSVGLGLKLN